MRPKRVRVDETRLPLASIKMASVIIAEMIDSDDCVVCATNGLIYRVSIPGPTCSAWPVLAVSSFTGVSSRPQASIR